MVHVLVPWPDRFPIRNVLAIPTPKAGRQLLDRQPPMIALDHLEGEVNDLAPAAEFQVGKTLPGEVGDGGGEKQGVGHGGGIVDRERGKNNSGTSYGTLGPGISP
jgi:hypothetical protein